MAHLIKLPLFVPINKSGKKYYLNLNKYRNTHYQTLNKAKVVFKDIVKNDINKLPSLNVIEIEYKLFTGTKRLCDVSNICSVVDKFFSDALVECGKLEDDNYLFLPKISFEFGSIDKLDPRVEAHIRTRP